MRNKRTTASFAHIQSVGVTCNEPTIHSQAFILTASSAVLQARDSTYRAAAATVQEHDERLVTIFPINNHVQVNLHLHITILNR